MASYVNRCPAARVDFHQQREIRGLFGGSHAPSQLIRSLFGDLYKAAKTIDKHPWWKFKLFEESAIRNIVRHFTPPNSGYRGQGYVPMANTFPFQTSTDFFLAHRRVDSRKKDPLGSSTKRVRGLILVFGCLRVRMRNVVVKASAYYQNESIDE
eukprot:1274195-Amorphochlora_amoeboformis.AAC.1